MDKIFGQHFITRCADCQGNYQSIYVDEVKKYLCAECWSKVEFERVNRPLRLDTIGG